ncbi:hypothetical protein RRG08_016775 [Elysia crispata]|uniref:Uncharacterized protein n=1 Tax=Elysia crispata TaxID=231223 RepID=A0AAE1A0E9_9GAST|nr:hypothetical protein RRG08_016775 [Elysia crispata]
MVLEITGDGKVTPRKGKEGRIFPKQSMNCEPNQDDINWLQGSKRASMWLRRKTKTGEYVAPEENQNGRVCGSGGKPKRASMWLRKKTQTGWYSHRNWICDKRTRALQL